MNDYRAVAKARAKQDIREARPSIVVFTLLYLAILLVLETLVTKLSGQDVFLQDLLRADYALESVRQPQISTVAGLLLAAISLMSSMLNVGYSLFAMNTVRRRAAIGNLFDPFEHFLRFLWLEIRMALFIWLWSLLFVIPGIIAAYRYRMAVYIMLDNPALGARDCMRLSREMTDGHKMELFVLDLSFLGWRFLTLIPLVSLWVNPYVELTTVHFYLRLDELARMRGAPFDTGGDPNWL